MRCDLARKIPKGIHSSKPASLNRPIVLSLRSYVRALKQEKRRAERQWLSSRLTVHKQIFNAVKHKTSRLVDNADDDELMLNVLRCQLTY